MIKLPWLEPSKWAGSRAVNSSTRTVFRIRRGSVILTLQQNPHTQVTRELPAGPTGEMRLALNAWSPVLDVLVCTLLREKG